MGKQTAGITPDIPFDDKAAFRKSSAEIWRSINKEVFGNHIPETASWTNLADIISLLNIVGSYHQVAHMYLPGGGDVDFKGAEKSQEAGCIELSSTEPLIVRPEKLLFSGFSDVSLNFFWLQTGALRHLDFSHMPSYTQGLSSGQSLIELGGGEYHPQGYEDCLSPDDQLKIERLRIVKWFHSGGDFLIYNKGAIYSNANMQDRHYTVGYEKFHTGIKKALEKLPADGKL